ncbi:ATP-binding protein [Halorubrum rubrum]|uniref:histidine kinase n=1 Tax=Halorubrum rubrum TaxID=1126240 RepID=A0ABD5QZ85_9EURY|nr:ATP-binding protein [Halorubrum rubrum]
MDVLCVDGDPDSLGRAMASVKRELPDATPRSARTVEGAVDLLATGRIDCVVSAHDLPDGTGIELLESVRESHGPLPFVLAPRAGADGEAVAAEAVAAGVSRYVPSGVEDGDRDARIAACVREAIEGSVETLASEHARQLEALHEASVGLIAATTRERVAEVAVTAASDIHGLEASTVYLHDPDANVVEPVASTPAALNLAGGPPTYGPGESIVWRVFERGEAEAVEDVPSDPDAHNPETPIRSQLTLPLDEYGVLVSGSHDPGTFDERDVTLGRILAGNAVAALEQVDRGRALEERNERLDEFVGVVSHDLRNPLAVATGRLDLARADLADAGVESEHLERVEYALDRIEALIDDLLRLAREDDADVDLEPLRLSALIDHCRGTVDTDGATLRTATDGTLRGDRGRVRQCFENLIRNSIEHGADEVTVVAGVLADGTGIYLEDDGPGIPPEKRERIFDAGYSTQRDGTGFGLRIVQRIVESHGWGIAVAESEPGGARFEITGVEFVADAE